MQEIQQQQGSGLARIESVQDPEVNRALFTIYSNLIEPVAQIERTHSEILDTQQVIAENEGKIRFSVSDAVRRTIRKWPLMAVVVFVILYILSCLEAVADMTVSMGLINAAVGAMILSAAWAFGTEAVSTASRERKRKEIYDYAVDALPKLEDSLQRQVSQIREVILFVPPKYRFSEALRYFVESYSNSRIDNLKEAVNSFDTYYFRSQSLQMQREILEIQQENSLLLQAIAYNQLCMMGQLDGIQRDIWLSGGIFS
ncbi:MAG: hypothetical protein NC307_15600 [Roseburia sp.]|nr:hypothetical protein [Roseburia sp.]